MDGRTLANPSTIILVTIFCLKFARAMSLYWSMVSALGILGNHNQDICIVIWDNPIYNSFYVRYLIILYLNFRIMYILSNVI